MPLPKESALAVKWSATGVSAICNKDWQGLHDELRPGRPRSISDEEVATLVRKTIETKPRDGTHWTIRAVAKDSELSRTTVHRIWQAFGLQPHRQRHFKLSTGPFFVEKVRSRDRT